MRVAMQCGIVPVHGAFNRFFRPPGRLRSILWCLSLSLLLGGSAEATQIHPASEGPVVHQIGHLFFLFAMGILIYWLRGRGLVREAGWRLLQYSALFFILWNADAFLVHYLDGRSDLFKTIDSGPWHGWVELSPKPHGLELLYYFGKMDHLLCVPAIVFLYLGLRQLLKQARLSEGEWP